jgi:peroxiredoxin
MLLRQNNVCLNTGEEAPDFTLPDQDQDNVTLSGYRGRCNVLLVFNPGTLNESCQDYLLFYREHLMDFSARDTQVLGINMDSSDNNKGWDQGIGGLGFPVLSDRAPLGGTTLKYDCFVPHEGYGKRVIFVIDKAGIIRHIEVLSGEHGACPDMNGLLGVLQDIQN